MSTDSPVAGVSRATAPTGNIQRQIDHLENQRQKMWDYKKTRFMTLEEQRQWDRMYYDISTKISQLRGY